MPENEIPDWVTKTPFETEYWLTMNHGEGVNVQEVELSRDESPALRPWESKTILASAL